METQNGESVIGIEELYARRGRNYPTRSDSILNQQDRDDWFTVAYDIMTRGGKHPENISKIARSGSSRVEVIKLFEAKKPQRSLWNILLGIVNSAKQQPSLMPTVLELDIILGELSPEPSTSYLESLGLSSSDAKLALGTAIPHSSTLGHSVIPRVSRRTQGLLAQSDIQSVQEVVSSYSHLSPKLQEVFRPLFGYKGEGNPADVASYNGHRQSISLIATELGLSYQTVYARFQKISEIIRGLKEQEEDSPIENEEVQTVVSASQERVENVLKTPTGNDLSIFPDVTHVNTLSPTQKADFLAFYGYKGETYDPTKAESYDTALCQTRDKIAEKRGANRLAIQMSIYTAYKKLRALSESSKSTKDNSDMAGPVVTDTPEIVLPAFLKKRIIPSALPRRKSDVVLEHTGETVPTPNPVSTPKKWAEVIRPPQPIRSQFVYTPPEKKQPTNGKTIITKTFRPTRGLLESDECTRSFEELVGGSSDAHIVGKVPAPKIEVVTPKKLRIIPEFTSYREAIMWCQQQKDWMEIIQQRTKTNPLYKDNMALLAWIQSHGIAEIIPFLDTLRNLFDKPRLKYNEILDGLFAPLPEEKISVTDIQRNTRWIGMISGAFQKHEVGDYVGFMQSMENILSDEVLASGIYDLMPEYDTSDPMAILTLLADKNWTSEDAIHYQNRTPKDVIGYKPGKYAGLDKVLGVGPHVKGKVLISELQSILIKAPIGETRWPRYREYQSPEVSLYAIVIALVKEDKGDIESPKTLFHKLEQIVR